ncbi:aldose epimerase family protein [Streptomyces sp. G-G2]|uniref:aldose epimerase family protein n=1 Tax=Streptomyces sp. G-G2 TaxID=3046201 RepID=UPI0024BABA3C|nr:aldose epimerase family protein [Streptomyces sp. G-G2]MDJ0386364.1 aldose epimerase family protein [Streptomyces sp. G-G2]
MTDAPTPLAAGSLTIRREPYATLPDGRVVDRWTFGSEGAITAEVLSLGARLQALYAPDRDGRRANVVLGGASVADMLGGAKYFGATIGRYANRIAGGELPVEGAVHRLATQESGHTLHGGPEGFDARVWDAAEVREPNRVGVRLTLRSPDRDQGFPGALTVQVTYLLDRAGSLTIGYAAVTDAPTVVNLTNHAYFNLAGEGSGTILDHVLRVDADQYTPVDGQLIPYGPHFPVEGTPFDLSEPGPVGERITADHPQLKLAGGGFDHNWVLRPYEGNGPRPVAVLRHPASGRRLECLTTEPGLQIYTGHLFDGSLTGPGGGVYGAFAGIALETQRFPDSPHRPRYPSTVLRPGEEYRSTTVYGFSVDPG